MIRQFDVVPNPLRTGRAEKPFLVCIQHHHLGHLTSRVMAPLLTRPIGHHPRLYPALRIGLQTYFLDPAEIVTIPVKRLAESIANLESERDRIVAALDLVFTGI